MPSYHKTRRADEDLKEIYRYTRRRCGRAQAEQYLRGLEQRFTALADNPLTGIAREDLRPVGLRSVVHSSHVVFYQSQALWRADRARAAWPAGCQDASWRRR